jgi:hypothetical protein
VVLKKRIILSVILTCLLIIPNALHSQKKPTRAQLKAAYIYKFTNFVFWPAEDQMRDFVICVMSSQELHNQLNGIANIVKFRSRIPIKVIYCRSVNDIKPCQMLVVDGSRNDNLWSIYSKIRGKGVLMIAENLVDYKKSMISFAEIGGNIKYIINKPKLEESNLVVKRQLYDNAIVKEREWSSIFDKFNAIASGAAEVDVNKEDIKQILNKYKDLEEEKKVKETMIARMEDTLKVKMETLKAKMHEYDQVSSRIQEQKELM